MGAEITFHLRAGVREEHIVHERYRRHRPFDIEQDDTRR
jgi:hypothetical protein